MANRPVLPKKSPRVIPTQNPIVAWWQGDYPGVKVEK